MVKMQWFLWGNTFGAGKISLWLKRDPREQGNAHSSRGYPKTRLFVKGDSSNTKQEALDTTIAIGAFVGANFDSVSQLNKELEEKEQELQKSKQELVQVEARHSQDIQ